MRMGVLVVVSAVVIEVRLLVCLYLSHIVALINLLRVCMGRGLHLLMRVNLVLLVVMMILHSRLRGLLLVLIDTVSRLISIVLLLRLRWLLLLRLRLVVLLLWLRGHLMRVGLHMLHSRLLYTGRV